MIALNVEPLARGAILQGVWIVTDKTPDGTCNFLRGYLPARADGEIIKTYLEDKGFDVQLETHYHDPRDGRLIMELADESKRTIEKQLKLGAAVKTHYIQIGKRAEDYDPQFPFLSTSMFKPEEITTRYFEETSSGEMPKQEDYQKAIISLLKQMALKKGMGGLGG